MAILFNILLLVLAGLLLGLAILRIREQKKLEEVVLDLERSRNSFGRTLDAVEEFINSSVQDAPAHAPTLEFRRQLDARRHYKAVKEYNSRAALPWETYQVLGETPLELTAYRLCLVAHGKRLPYGERHRINLKTRGWLEEDSNEYGFAAVH